jgi:hypothetical protein
VREDTLRNLGHFSAVSLFMFLLLVSSLVSGNFTFASSQTAEGQFPQSIIVASSTDTTPHALELRAIQDGDNAEPRKVSQFKLDMTNVVTAQVNSQLLVFLTDNSVRVLEAKVRTVSDQLIDLAPSTQANAFSLANLPVGVYTLDVMTQKGNAKAAYEGILVISQQPTTVISETTRNIINQMINQNTRVIIDDGDGGNGGDGGCPPGQFFNDTSKKCQDEKPPVCPEGTTGTPPNCKPIRLCTLGMDAASRACAEGISVEEYCKKNPTTQGCPGYELGGGVPVDDGPIDDGKVDPIDPPICTPDGPECPPCPEGVEAGWCADEEERSDTDDCLRPDGTERFPGCSDPEPVVDEEESTEREEGDENGDEEDEGSGGGDEEDEGSGGGDEEDEGSGGGDEEDEGSGGGDGTLSL